MFTYPVNFWMPAAGPTTLTFVEGQKTDFSNSGAPVTVTLASAAVAGDVILFSCYVYGPLGDDPSFASYPTGHTQLPDSPFSWGGPATYLACGYKIASGGETAFTWAFNDNGAYGYAAAVVLRPSETMSVGNIDGSYDWNVPYTWTITTTTERAWVIAWAGAWGSSDPADYDDPPTTTVWTGAHPYHPKAGTQDAQTVGDYTVSVPAVAHQHKLWLIEVKP